MTMAKKFQSLDGKTFTVEELVQDGKELWVYYHDINTGNKYSCLLEAFTERFRAVENEQ
jgi:hypothetical protein